MNDSGGSALGTFLGLLLLIPGLWFVWRLVEVLM